MRNYLAIIVGAMSLACGEAQAACSSPTGKAGDMVFNAAQHIMQFCDDTAWRGIGVAGTGSSNCSSPTGVPGAIVFNSSFSVMQYCNGTNWSPMAKVGVAPSLCTASPTTITATGSSTYNVPANCTQVTVEAFGAGGSGSSTSARGASGGGGASAVIRNTGSVLLVVGGGGGGGGGIDGGGTASRGGGGGYALSTVTVTPGEQLNTYVGSGGVKASSDTGGAGGATSPYNGGAGGNRRANGTAATYGGGGGGGAENSGANSTYGGAGGRGDNGGPSCGTSTNGGACSTIHGGGGGGYSSSGGTVILGSNGLTGTAANGGTGTGNSNATGGNGKIVITPSGATSGCTSPTGIAGDLMYNSSYRLLQYCDSSTWQRVGAFQPTLFMDFAANQYSMNGTSYGSLAALLTATSGTFTRASTATYFDVAGVMQTAASGALRFDYNPLTHESRGVLIEEARTNTVIRSNAIDNASWYKAAGISVTANATTAPDGTLSAESVSPTAAANSYVSQSASSQWTAGDTVTRSIYAKAGVGSTVIFQQVVGGSYVNANTVFDLSTGTVGTTANGVAASMQDVGNGWYRLIATRTWAAADDANNRFDFVVVDADGSATVGNNVYLWGAQMEIGPNVTSYIPTVAATVTRAQDVLTVPTPLWYNASQGTFFAETYGEKNDYGSIYSGYVIGVGGGTDKNIIDFSSGLDRFEAWCNGSDPSMPTIFSPPASQTQSVKVGFSWNAATTTRTLIASGGPVTTGSYGSYGCDYTAPSIRIGGNAGGATLNAPIKQIHYYPFAIPNTELQSAVQQ